MFGGFFDTDKPFWAAVCRIPELVALTFFWFICCIPIVTIIPSCTALFDAIARCTAEGDKGSFTRFFRTFKNELKQGIPITLFWLVLAVVMLYGNDLMEYNAGLNPDKYQLLAVAYKLNFVVFFGVLAWIVPMQSRFINTFGRLHLNAMKLFLGRLPHTILLLLIVGLFVLLFLVHPIFYMLLVIAPALIALLQYFVVDKVFHKVFPEYYVDSVRSAIGAVEEESEEQPQEEE